MELEQGLQCAHGKASFLKAEKAAKMQREHTGEGVHRLLDARTSY